MKTNNVREKNKQETPVYDFETVDAASFKSYLQLSFNLLKRPQHRWKFAAIFSAITLIWGPVLYVGTLLALMILNFVLFIIQKIL